MTDEIRTETRFKLTDPTGEDEGIILTGSCINSLVSKLGSRMDCNIEAYEGLIAEYVEREGDPLDQLLYRLYKDYIPEAISYSFDMYLMDCLAHADEDENGTDDPEEDE